MTNNYDRTELLHQALVFREKSAEWLEEQLNTPIAEIINALRAGKPEQISSIADALNMPDNYFWGGSRIENGSLVNVNPE